MKTENLPEEIIHGVEGVDMKVTLQSPAGHQVDPTQTQRRHARFQLSMPIKVRLMINEDSTQPNEMEGYSVDVSELGMKFSVGRTPQKTFIHLLRHKQSARITFKNPMNGSNVSIHGTIAWFSYHNDYGRPNYGVMTAAISLDDLDVSARAEYATFIAGLKKLLCHA